MVERKQTQERECDFWLKENQMKNFLMEKSKTKEKGENWLGMQMHFGIKNRADSFECLKNKKKKISVWSWLSDMLVLAIKPCMCKYK